MARMPEMEVEFELKERNTMNLYEYAVILHPTKKDKKEGARSVVVVPVTAVVAENENEVRLIAAKAIPDKHDDETDRLEVAVRPFC